MLSRVPNNEEHLIHFGFYCYFLREKKNGPLKGYCFSVTRLVSDRAVSRHPTSHFKCTELLFSLGIESLCSPLRPLPLNHPWLLIPFPLADWGFVSLRRGCKDHKVYVLKSHLSLPCHHPSWQSCQPLPWAPSHEAAVSSFSSS